MRLAILTLPVLLAVPVAATAVPLWDRWQLACEEPTFAWPVAAASGGRTTRPGSVAAASPTAYVIRHDAYGSGLFGSHRSGGRSHNGIDLAAPLGAPVRAAKSGVVRWNQQRSGMGTYLELFHPDGSVTLYGHLSGVLVNDGQWVRRGQPIGLVGKSGNARARAIHAHLHFELRLRGVPVDPLDGYLEGTGA